MDYAQALFECSSFKSVGMQCSIWKKLSLNYEKFKKWNWAWTMKNLGNRIDVRPVNNEKDYLKWTSKPSSMSHKIEPFLINEK